MIAKTIKIIINAIVNNKIENIDVLYSEFLKKVSARKIENSACIGDFFSKIDKSKTSKK